MFMGMALSQLSDENRTYRLTEDSSSAGFWLQHVSEAKLFLIDMFWGLKSHIPTPTNNGAYDEGQCGNTAYIVELDRRVNAIVEAHLDSLTDEQLAEVHNTFIGPMTTSQMFGVLIQHTYYHMGQAQLAIKKGQHYAKEIRMAA